MTFDPLFINASVSGAPSYTANELRQGLGALLLYNGRAMGGRAGVRPGVAAVVTYSNPTITVNPHTGVIDPALSTPQGSYLYGLGTAETHTATAAHATNPRKDIIVARVYDTDEDASGLRIGRSEYIVGTPAGSPSEPAVPAGSIKLATLDVPATGGGGLGSAVVTLNHTYTVANGGILPLRSSTEETALTPWQGQLAYRMDTALFRVRGSAAWRDLGEIIVCTSGTRPAHVEGRTIYETDTDRLLTSDGTNWTNPKNIPAGILGVATPLTSNVGPTSGTTELDVITAPAVTPATASRRLRIRFHCRGISGGTAGEQFVFRLKEGGTTLDEHVYTFAVVTITNTGVDFSTVVSSPTLAAHTYKVTIQRTSGAGVATVNATATGPITLTVEDVGGV